MWLAGPLLSTAVLLPRAARAPAPRMGVSPDRMPSQGMLYDGWGKEQLVHLNNSCALIDKGYERGLNRFELAIAIARRAKESAYAAVEEAPLGVRSHGGIAHRPRKSHVVRAMQELRDEADALGVLQLTSAPPDAPGMASTGGLAPSPPEQLRNSETAPRDGFAAGGSGGSASAPRSHNKRGNPAAPPHESLDGDGGAAKLEDINQLLLASETAEMESAAKPAAAGARGNGLERGGSGKDDGLEALLAGIASMDLDEDFDDDLDLDFGDFDPSFLGGDDALVGDKPAAKKSPNAGADVALDGATRGGGGLEALLGLDGADDDLLGDDELIDDEKLLELLGGDASQL